MDLCLQRDLWDVYTKLTLPRIHLQIDGLPGFNYWEVLHKEATLGFGCFPIPGSALWPG